MTYQEAVSLGEENKTLTINPDRQNREEQNLQTNHLHSFVPTSTKK